MIVTIVETTLIYRNYKPIAIPRALESSDSVQRNISLIYKKINSAIPALAAKTKIDDLGVVFGLGRQDNNSLITFPWFSK